MLQLGLVSAILPELTLEGFLGYASELGFDCAELMCWPRGAAERRYAGVTHVDVDAIDNAFIENFHQNCEKYKIGISGLGYYPNPLDPDKAKSDFFIAHIQKVILAASRLQIPVVNTFIGRDPKASVEENLEQFKRLWPDIISFAGDMGVKVAIENCPMFFTMDEWPGGKNLATTPEIWDRMFEIIPSPNFGLNYDPSHMIWQMMDPYKPVLDYHERFHHVHLKDAHVHRDRLDRVGIMATPLSYHSPRIPGRGDLDWKKFMDTLKNVGYSGAACIEVEDKEFEGSEADVKKAINLAYNHLRECMKQ